MLGLKYQLWTIFYYVFNHVQVDGPLYPIWIQLKRNFQFFARLWNLKKEFENIFACLYASYITETSRISSRTPEMSNKIKFHPHPAVLRNVVIDTQIWAQIKMLIKFNPQHVHSSEYLWMTFFNTFISIVNKNFQ